MAANRRGWRKGKMQLQPAAPALSVSNGSRPAAAQGCSPTFRVRPPSHETSAGQGAPDDTGRIKTPRRYTAAAAASRRFFRSQNQASQMQTSYRTQSGTAIATWVITSGVVSTAPRINEATITCRRKWASCW